MGFIFIFCLDFYPNHCNIHIFLLLQHRRFRHVLIQESICLKIILEN